LAYAISNGDLFRSKMRLKELWVPGTQRSPLWDGTFDDYRTIGRNVLPEKLLVR